MGFFDIFFKKENKINDGGKRHMINLEKGSTIRLDKDDRNEDITRLTIGCAWSPAKSGPDIDIDLSAAGYDKRGNRVQLTYFGDKSGLTGVQSLGDNTSGAGEGDDETLVVDLNKVKSTINKVVIFINIYQAQSRGQNLSMMRDTSVRIYNHGYKYAEFTCENIPAVTGMVLCEMTRSGNSWEFTSLGKPVNISSIQGESNTYDNLMN